MHIKRILFVLMSVLLLNCSSDDNSVTSEEGLPPTHLLEFKKQEITLLLDEKVNLIYELSLKNIDLVNLQWFTSSPEVVTIQGTSIVAKKQGQSQVSVKDKSSGVSTSVLVKVELPEAPKISFKKESLEIDGEVSRVVDLKELLVFENTILDSISWKSSDSSKATVENGVVTFYRDGEVEIHAGVSDFSISAVIVLKVNDVGVLQLQIIGKDRGNFLLVDEQFQFWALETSYGETEKKPLKWSTSDPSVFTVDDTGLVTAKGVGDGYLTVTAPNGVNDKVLVEVKGYVEITDVGLSNEFYGSDLISGDHGYIYVYLIPIDAELDNLEFISDRPDIATVDKQGLVRSVKGKEGTVNITVYSKGDPDKKYIKTIEVVNRFYRFNLSASFDGIQKDNKLSGMVSLSVHSESLYKDTISELKVFDKQGALIQADFKTITIGYGGESHTYNFNLDEVEEPYITYKLEQKGEVEYRKQKLIF